MRLHLTLVCMTTLISTTWAQVQPFDPAQIGQPTQLLGLPLLPSQARLLDAAGKESLPQVVAPDAAALYFAGYPSAGVPQGSKLTWTLPEETRGSFFVYFLVRTGHQRGYEYVSPYMTYFVELDGQSVPIELFNGLAPVRTFRHPDGWGYDLGWIRSQQPLTLGPGSRLAIGCREEYAIVCQGLLVSEKADKQVMTFRALQQRLSDGRQLEQRLGEVFPELAPWIEQARAASGRVARRTEKIEQELKAAAERVKAGGRLDVEALLAPLPAVCRDLDRAEQESCGRLQAGLDQVRHRLEARQRQARLDNPVDFAGREAQYALGVARTYLNAAAKIRAPRTWRELCTQASYYWRADQFLDRAEAALGHAQRTSEPQKRPPAPKLQPHLRVRVLLNGVWEMSTDGSPEKPPTTGWFGIRVPHGPWHETVGQFMALGRRLPPGQAWAWYRTRFTVPQEMAGGAIFLCFDAVFHLCEAYVNGNFVGRHIGGFDRFEFEVTPYVRAGQRAELLCFVHDTSYTALEKSTRPGEPQGVSSGPNHYVISDLWGARFLGIWQDVSLESRPAVWTDEVLVAPSVRKRRLTVRTNIKGLPALLEQPTSRPEVTLRQDVLKDGQVVLRLPEARVALRKDGARHEVTQPWPDPQLWGIGGEYGDPRNLYVLRTQLFLPGQRNALDVRYDRFGFREFWIENGHFWLNGRRLPLQGGGTWYLQEGKAPHGNRWWAIRFFGLERSMNVNIERWHRHGDVAGDILDAADELGMLNELEAPYWGVSGIPDLLGYSDWNDPVWVANATDYYQRWVRKHFNHPSVVLWSLENESFCPGFAPSDLVDRFFEFGKVVKQLDPTRPITYHGSENGRRPSKDPRFEIINLHYPDDVEVADWRKTWGGRPCIDGEFQSYPPLFGTCSNRPDVAAENMAKLQQCIEHKFRYYADIDLPGAFYFTPYMAGLVSTARPEWMGPWGDLLGPPEKAQVVESGWAKGMAIMSAYVPITWPSLSGPGIKCEQLRTGVGHASVINWFDPSRPEATPTPVASTIARCWRAMPDLRPDTAPEVVVAVSRGGEPVPGVPVLAVPAAGQAAPITGAVTDPAGTAWLVLPAEGDYEITVAGRSMRWQAHRLPRKVKPGWEHIPRIALALD